MLRTRTGGPRLGRARGGGEVERLPDGEGGEVDIVFGTVLDVATVVLGELRGGEGVVVHVTVDVMKLAALVSQTFEESATSRSRAA